MSKADSVLNLLEGSKYDKLIKQIIAGWKDNFSDWKFKNTVEAVDMAFNLASEGAWGEKVRGYIKDGIEDFQQALTSAIEKAVKDNGQLTESKDLKAMAKRFIKANPYPDDSKLHSFCDKEGISPHDLETAVYAVLSDYIKKYN